MPQKRRDFRVPASPSPLNELLTKNSRCYFDRPREFQTSPSREPLLNVWALDCGFPVHLRKKETEKCGDERSTASESGWDSCSMLSSVYNTTTFKDLRDFFDRPMETKNFAKQRYESRRRNRSAPVQRPWTLDEKRRPGQGMARPFWDTGRNGGNQLNTHIDDRKFLLRTPVFYTKPELSAEDPTLDLRTRSLERPESDHIKRARDRLAKLVL